MTCESIRGALAPFIKRYLCEGKPDAPAVLIWQGLAHFMALPAVCPDEMVVCPGEYEMEESSLYQQEMILPPTMLQVPSLNRECCMLLPQLYAACVVASKHAAVYP